MPRLTDATLRSAKPAAKVYTLTDGAGLTLLVNPVGSKLWIVRYRYLGKGRRYAAGPYPDVGLAQARDIARKVRQIVRDGGNPVAERRHERAEAKAAAGQTFKLLAEAWIERQAPRWSPGYRAQIERMLKRDVYPNIGALPVHTITPRGMATWFQPLCDRSPTVARALRQHISAVFDFAASRGLLEGRPNPASRLSGLVATQAVTPRAAACDIDSARAVLAAVEAVASPMVALAHRWLVLTASRTSEALGARWSEITGLDGAAPVWVLPKGRMKARRLHAVPLAPEAVDVLRAVRALGVPGELVFSLKGRTQIARATLLETFKRATLPVRHVPHGWRSTFSTVLNERFPEDRQQIDLALAHAAGGRSAADVSGAESAYNRASHLARRRKLAGVWAGLILAGAPSAASLAGLADVAAEGERRAAEGEGERRAAEGEGERRAA